MCIICISQAWGCQYLFSSAHDKNAGNALLRTEVVLISFEAGMLYIKVYAVKCGLVLLFLVLTKCQTHAKMLKCPLFRKLSGVVFWLVSVLFSLLLLTENVCVEVGTFSRQVKGRLIFKHAFTCLST